MKHVARENGILPTDERNIHELIRIPENPDHLKIFRCKFCPGEGRLFVGLSEETFVAHVTSTHGNKVARRRPEKLKRECRICGKVSATDTELGEHIEMHSRMMPFAGFGPRGDSDQSRSDSGNSRAGVAPSRRSSRALRSTKKEIDLFVKNIRRTADEESSSRRRRRAESSDDEARRDMQSSLERKRRRQEDSLKERRLSGIGRTPSRSGRAGTRTGRVEADLEEGELAWSPGSSNRRRGEGQARSRRDGWEEKADGNRNSIRIINKHLASGSSGSGDDWRRRRREDSGERPAKRLREEQEDRRSREEEWDRGYYKKSREEDRDRGYHKRSREEDWNSGYLGRSREGGRDGGFPYGGRGGGSRGGWGGRGSRGGRGGFSRGGLGGGGGSRGARGGFSREGRGRGGGFEDRGRYQERGEDWRCGNCGFQNFPDRMECYKCKNAKSNVPQPPQTNAMDDMRNEIEQMMQQHQQDQQERDAASNVIAEIIQTILDEVIDLAVLESEMPRPPPVIFPDSPDSPTYLPPEDEDEAMVSAEVLYECAKCLLKGDNLYEIMMHLEDDHDLPGDEDILMMNVREIKTKEKMEASEVPDSTKISVKENNENNN